MPDLVPNDRHGAVPEPYRDRGFMPDMEPGYPAYPVPARDEIDLRAILQVLRRNAWLVFTITMLCGAAAAVMAYSQAPEYRATAVLRLKNERQAMTGGIAGGGIGDMLGKSSDPLLSEIQVLRSRTVVGEVVNRLGLRMMSATDGFSLMDLEDPIVAPDAAPDTIQLRFNAEHLDVRSTTGAQSVAYGQPVYAGGVRFTVSVRPEPQEVTFFVRSMDVAVEDVTTQLNARLVDRTDVVEVEHTATDPRLAQLVVNTAVDVFQNVSVQNALAESMRRRAFLEEQLARTDSVLAEAQLALSHFREREEVFSSREQFATQQAGMMELDVRREELNADRRMYRTLLSGLEGDTDGSVLRTLVSSPGIAQNAVVSQLYMQLAQYRASRDSAVAAGRSAENPDVRRYNSLIASTQLQLADAVASHIMSVDARIAALDTLRMRNSEDIRALPQKEAEEMRLMQQVETTRRVADQLREEYQRARIAEAVEIGQVEVVDRATLPYAPIGAGRPLKLALGLVLGLMLGSGAALLREHMNTSIRRNDEIETVLNLPSLAVVPRLGSLKPTNRMRLAGLADIHSGNGKALVSRPLENLVTVTDVRSSGAEAYRSLRTNLMFSQGGDALKRIVVTSPFAAEGKTTTSSNLAVTYAQQGLRVLLIDGDLRKSQLHRMFGLTREPGFSELMLGMADPKTVVHATGVDGLTVLTSGTLPPNPSELLGSARTRKLLDDLGADYDMMIIDAPPVLVAGDAPILGLLSDGVVMVVRAGKTERGAAQAAVRQLQNVGARILGAVLNDPDAKVPHDDGSYYYAYSYYGEEKH